MSKGTELNKQSLVSLFNKATAFANRYIVLIFILILASVYGFVVFQVYLAQGAQPKDADIAAQEQATSKPHIDQTIVSQIQSLQDHSVNVKTLFDEARSNPFHE